MRRKPFRIPGHVRLTLSKDAALGGYPRSPFLPIPKDTIPQASLQHHGNIVTTRFSTTNQKERNQRNLSPVNPWSSASFRRPLPNHHRHQKKRSLGRGVTFFDATRKTTTMLKRRCRQANQKRKVTFPKPQAQTKRKRRNRSRPKSLCCPTNYGSKQKSKTKRSQKGGKTKTKSQQ